jgi:hypothetical protein
MGLRAGGESAAGGLRDWGGHTPDLGNSCPGLRTESGDHSGEGPRGAGLSLVHPETISSTDYPPESDMTFA